VKGACHPKKERKKEVLNEEKYRRFLMIAYFAIAYNDGKERNNDHRMFFTVT